MKYYTEDPRQSASVTFVYRGSAVSPRIKNSANLRPSASGSIRSRVSLAAIWQIENLIKSLVKFGKAYISKNEQVSREMISNGLFIFLFGYSTDTVMPRTLVLSCALTVLTHWVQSIHYMMLNYTCLYQKMLLVITVTLTVTEKH